MDFIRRHPVYVRMLSALFLQTGLFVLEMNSNHAHSSPQRCHNRPGYCVGVKTHKTSIVWRGCGSRTRCDMSRWCAWSWWNLSTYISWKSDVSGGNQASRADMLSLRSLRFSGENVKYSDYRQIWYVCVILPWLQLRGYACRSAFINYGHEQNMRDLWSYKEVFSLSFKTGHLCNSALDQVRLVTRPGNGDYLEVDVDSECPYNRRLLSRIRNGEMSMGESKIIYRPEYTLCTIIYCLHCSYHDIVENVRVIKV